MNAYDIMIQVCNSTPIIWRKIEVSDELSFQQLHEAILILFHWKQERDAFFQIANQIVRLEQDDSNSHSLLPLSAYLQDATPFTYTYGNEDEELWEVSLFASQIENNCANLRFLDYEQENPIYGLGGILLYQNVKKEVENIQHESVFQFLFNRLTYPFKVSEISSQFESIVKTSEQSIRSGSNISFHHELLQCRTLLENARTITPHLVLINIQGKTHPCYIDFLDDGIEIMIFNDQSGYARSIINSLGDDPDLLFTNAFAIDFLYEESEETNLYLYDKRNLCFVHRAGTLPTCPKDKDFLFLTKILKQLNHVLHSQELPSLASHKMLVVQDNQIIECPYEINEEVCSVQLSKKEKARLLKLPHTNERIKMNFVAVGNAHSEESNSLEIHFVASGNRYKKDKIIHVDNMPLLIEQLYHYLDELLHDRCIPESIITQSINLAHILQPYCDQLNIDVQLFRPSAEYKESILDIITNNLNLTAEELLMIDMIEKKEDTKQPIYKDNYSISNPKATSKFFN